MAAVTELATAVGTRAACHALFMPRGSYYQDRRSASALVRTAPRPRSVRALAAERETILSYLHQERFQDRSPAAVYATLLDEGQYHCSIRTMYRLLAAQGESRERRDQLTHPHYQKPELLATAPNQLWSWDITKLLGPAQWTYFYLDVILDVFSRYVTGWMVALRESTELAKRLIADSCTKQRILPGQLTLHADRGTSMSSKPVAFLLADLGVTKTHSRFSHDWLLAHVPMDRAILQKWLKAGYMDKHVLHETTDGTPQGGIISPALSNCALDGLERLLKEKFPTRRPLSSLGGKFPCVNLIRYADDFIITGRTKELLEGEIKPLVEQFLQKRGLELSPAKTVITHVGKGFDFLGQNVRKYPNGKLLIKPSKKNVKTFLGGIRKIIKAALGMSAADLIDWLNPKIRGWVNYHRHVVSKRVFHRVDHVIFTSLWQWARRRHQKKSPGWLKQKYFEPQGGNSWIFFGESCDNEGIPHKVRLLLASRTPIQRHVKVKGEANPYNPACEPYFEKREGDHMSETFRGTRTLRFLWHEQSGLCAICKERITRITGWRLHYCVPRVLGGSHSVENRTLLHPECHDRVHCQPLSVSKPRLPERGVRRA